jgi:MarR family 2-MHQ and catechol resistance regulon transcriptional repressor
MGIKEDIKQIKDFRSEHHKAAVNIIYTHCWLTEEYKKLFEPHQITLQQYNVLRILRGSFPDPISTLEIRNRMLDKMSDVSRIVDRLLAKELLTKKTCPTDKRLVDVLISKKGIEVLECVDQLNHVMDAFLHGVSEEEASLLNQLLDKLRSGHS